MSNTSHLRRAYSLIEVLVACAVLGAGTATLAAALLGDRALRRLAAEQEGAALRARTRLESLAVRPCVADTGGVSVEAWGSESWRAAVSAGSWRLTDSLVLRRSRVPVVIEATVACQE